MKKRGQGLPLNTIIIAIIVLVVLVVIITFFVGNIGKTQRGIDESVKLELLKYKPSYGSCHPTALEEENFLSRLSKAEGENDPNVAADERARFQALIENCKEASTCDGGCTTS